MGKGRLYAGSTRCPKALAEGSIEKNPAHAGGGFSFEEIASLRFTFDHDVLKLCN